MNDKEKSPCPKPVGQWTTSLDEYLASETAVRDGDAMTQYFKQTPEVKAIIALFSLK